jgi:hypothetical protein
LFWRPELRATCGTRYELTVPRSITSSALKLRQDLKWIQVSSFKDLTETSFFSIVFMKLGKQDATGDAQHLNADKGSIKLRIILMAGLNCRLRREPVYPL